MTESLSLVSGVSASGVHCIRYVHTVHTVYAYRKRVFSEFDSK